MLGGFVLAEIAIATVLLIGAGLVVKSLRNMHLFDPGFTSSQLLTMHFHTPAGVGTESFFDEMVREIEATPGVESAAITSHVYFGDGYMSGDVTVEGFEPKRAADEIKAFQHFVSEDYFRVMEIPIAYDDVFSYVTCGIGVVWWCSSTVQPSPASAPKAIQEVV